MKIAKAKAFTFYSYKGGSGRSTTAINTVKHLAQQLHASAEHPVLLVDTDLESAGLTYFFNCEHKFSNDLPRSIHTNKLLARPESLEAENGDIICGKAKLQTNGLHRNIIQMSEKVCEYVGNGLPIEQVLSDVKLPVIYADMLETILEEVTKYNAAQRVDGLDMATRRVMKMYNVEEWFRELYKIEKSMSANKAEEKADYIMDKLPAAKFVDISEHFGLEKGSVRFLGVAVSYEGEQLVQNGTEIDCILRECGRRGYSAVIFDSGAGTQSTAHVLHSASDVLVYCMRPTQQFIRGTRMQLFNYEHILAERQEIKNDMGKGTKAIILLPTAVPDSGNSVALRKKSFDAIQKIAQVHESVIDSYFCTPETALNEVEVFKWEEKILGVGLPSQKLDTDLAADEDAAYKTYAKLAEHLLKNSGGTPA